MQADQTAIVELPQQNRVYDPSGLSGDSKSELSLATTSETPKPKHKQAGKGCEKQRLGVGTSLASNLPVIASFNRLTACNQNIACQEQQAAIFLLVSLMAIAEIFLVIAWIYYWIGEPKKEVRTE